MPTTAIFCGILLILIGLVGFINAVMNFEGSGSALVRNITALIPSFIGILLLLSGILANAKESLRKHLIHAAVIVALLGFIATAGRLISRMSALTMSPAVISQALTALICLLFVILAIRSFAAARRSSNA